MTKQKKLEKNNSNSKKSGNNYLKNFIVMILLVILAIIVIDHWESELIQQFYPSKTIVINKNQLDSAEKNNKSPHQNNEIIENALENDYITGAEPPILRFAPDAQDTQNKTNSKENTQNHSTSKEEDDSQEDPYVKIIDKEEKENYQYKKIKSIILSNNLREYRLYLANFSKLMAKFEADEIYGDELNNLKKYYIPTNLQKLLASLDMYNKKLIQNKNCNQSQSKNQNLVNNDIKLFGSNLLSQFVKIKKLETIEKKSSSFEEKTKKEIKMNLNNLFDYVFSSELQDSFLEK